mgnify:CR=1 FL=1
MRQKRVIPGLNNSQKIRVILNGVGFQTTVEGMTNMCFTHQRLAVWNALQHIADMKDTAQPISGFASRSKFYNEKDELVDVDYQVDLL